MFGLGKKKISDKEKQEKNFRLKNDVLRRNHELEELIKKRDEIYEKGKNENNPQLKQLIANEYTFITKEIKRQTIALKVAQKALYANQSFTGIEEYQKGMEDIEKLTIASVDDLAKLTKQVAETQMNIQARDSKLQEVEEFFDDNLDEFGVGFENDSSKAIIEQWNTEKELELMHEADEEPLEELIENKEGDL